MINYDSIFEDTDYFVQQFETGKIKISSLNYYLEQNETKIWFLPKPISFNEVDTENYKSFKKIAFISKKIFETIQSPLDLLAEDILIIQDVFAVKKEELNIDETLIGDLKVYNSIVHQKVDVFKEEDNLYQLDVIEIADNSLVAPDISVGFYFLLETSSDFDLKFGNRFTTVLEVLKSAGIGAERSTMGQISDISIENDWNIQITTPHETAALSVSMIHPNGETSKIVYAQTALRGGRVIGGRKRLKVVRMLSEGAIVEKDIKGHIVDIAPKDWDGVPFLRNGKAITLDVNKKWFEHEQE